MKQLFFSLRFALLVFLLGWAVNSMAYDFESGGIWFDRISETEVEAKSFSPLYHSDEHLSIPSTVTDGGRTYTVTSIAQSAFSSTSLTSVYIPTTIRYIGSWAFKNCPNLTKVEISDLTAWCKINFDYIRRVWCNDEVFPPGYYTFFRSGGSGSYYGGNPLEIAHHLYLNNEEVIDLVIPETVDTIPEGAFCGCSEIRSVVIGSRVKKIGSFAFGDCEKLKEFTVGENVISLTGPICDIYDFPVPSCMEPTLFWGHSKRTKIERLTWNAKSCQRGICATYWNYTILDLNTLKEVIIGDKVETIPALFVPYSQITEVNIPNSVKTICVGAFYYCSELTNVTMGNSVKTIDDNAFENCTSLTNLTIPNSVTRIGQYAFQNCTNLMSLNIGNSVNSIGVDAFSGTAWLINQTDGLVYAGPVAYCYKGTMPAGTDITLNEGTKGIADYAGISLNTIPNSVTNIGEYALGGGLGFNEPIPNSVESISRRAFETTTWYKNQPDGLVYAGLVAYKYKGTMPNGTDITLNEGTKGIAGDAFLDCTGLTSITIPNSVTNIGDMAFSGCTGLTSITIPNSVSTIGRHAFQSCSGITSLDIGKSVTTIGTGAFRNCTGLTTIICNAIVPPTVLYTEVWSSSSEWINDSTLSYATLYVPKASLQDYRNTYPWSKFQHIEPNSEDVETGDVNGDGRVNIGDVTDLIDLLLTGNTENNLEADVNGDGRVNIGDVTELIDILLTTN